VVFLVKGNVERFLDVFRSRRRGCVDDEDLFGLPVSLRTICPTELSILKKL
jgi:hypothetical protein